MSNNAKTITVMECRYCDHTIPHRPYGMDDVAVCLGCGAEWDPVAVQHDVEELDLFSDDQVVKCVYCPQEAAPESNFCFSCEEEVVGAEW